MKRSIVFCAGCAASIVACRAGSGATLSAVSPTNAFYTQDVVYDVATNAVNATFGARNFFEQGDQNPTSAAAGDIGLNTNRAYTVTSGSDTINFQLQPYNASNVRQVSSGSTAVFNLPAPSSGQSYSEFSLAMAETNSQTGGNATVTIAYSDLSTSQQTFLVPNWGNSGYTNEIFNVARTNGDPHTTSANNVQPGNTWSAYYFNINSDPAKVATSISIAPAASPSLVVGVFAVSAAQVPEPASLGLFGGMLALLLRRRRPA